MARTLPEAGPAPSITILMSGRALTKGSTNAACMPLTESPPQLTSTISWVAADAGVRRAVVAETPRIAHIDRNVRRSQRRPSVSSWNRAISARRSASSRMSHLPSRPTGRMQAGGPRLGASYLSARAARGPPPVRARGRPSPVGPPPRGAPPGGGGGGGGGGRHPPRAPPPQHISNARGGGAGGNKGAPPPRRVWGPHAQPPRLHAPG